MYVTICNLKGYDMPREVWVHDNECDVKSCVRKFNKTFLDKFPDTITYKIGKDGFGRLKQITVGL